jgi:N6-L-threonylcarbamoyladenine synthase
MAGGVSANGLLRQAVAARTELPVYFPPLALCTDNAAMIGAAAHWRWLAGQRDDLALDVLPMLPLVSTT